MPKYLTEFIGTFFLVLTIGLTTLAETPLAPLAIGSVLMVLVYMGGHVSGAHYNPAASLAIMLRGKLRGKELVPYLVAQLAGALAAGILVFATVEGTFAPAPDPGVSSYAAVLIEVFYTFILCLVILNVATAKTTEGNSYYGLAIGFTIAAAMIAGGPVSGGVFNPAVGTGPILIHALLGDGSFGDLWLYLVGPLLGGALAAGVFKLQGVE